MDEIERKNFILQGLSIVVDGLNDENAELRLEIERLRSVAAQLAKALELQCQLQRVPVTTRPHYTQHALDALAAFEEVRNG